MKGEKKGHETLFGQTTLLGAYHWLRLERSAERLVLCVIAYLLAHWAYLWTAATVPDSPTTPYTSTGF